MTIAPKHLLKGLLEKNGWYLRKTKGLASGVDCFFELRYRIGAHIATVLDVGAHHGETTFEILRKFPDATVHALEPVRINFEALKVAVQHLPNVVCHQIALGDCTNTVEIPVQKDSQTHTLRPHVGLHNTHSRATTRVQVTTLDLFLQSTTIHQVDLLKVDVEGYELNVLNGSRKTLSTNPPTFVLLEASLDPTDDLHSPLNELATFLNDYSYRLMSIYDQVVWRQPKRLAYFNALFCFESCH